MKQDNRNLTAALEAVLDYLWDDNESDFRDDPSSSHIFVHLVTIRIWLGTAAQLEHQCLED